MCDRRIRELERAAQDGDVCAEVAALRERVRAGLLTWELLDLAAYLGHAAAQELTGRATVERGDCAVGVLRCFAELQAWGQEVQLRALAAVGRAVLSSGHRASWLGQPWQRLCGMDVAPTLVWALLCITNAEVWEAIDADLVPWALSVSRPSRDSQSLSSRSHAA